MYHYYYINFLFLCVCMLFSYVLTYPLRMCVATSGVYVTCMGVQCDCFHLYIFSGGVCAAVCRKVRVKSEIWGCMYRSYAGYSYWFYKSDIFPRYSKGRAIAQAVSRWLPIVAARVRARVWSSGICGEQSGAGAGFLWVLRFPLPIFIPPNSPSS
jgi:hypothetical protein